jgi:hypothetical protein
MGKVALVNRSASFAVMPSRGREMFRQVGMMVGLVLAGIVLLGAGPAPKSDGTQKGEPPHMEPSPAHAPYSAEDYKRDKDEKAAVWFLNDEDFRQRVVADAMRTILLRWGAWVGVANILALIGIWYSVTKSAEKTVTTEVEKVVKAKTDFVDQSVKIITSTAVSRVAEMQSELSTAQQTLAKSSEQVAHTMAKAADTLKEADDVKQASGHLRQKQTELSYALGEIASHGVWLNDPKNVDRTAAFVKLVTQDNHAKAIADLAAELHNLNENYRDLAFWVYKPQTEGKTLEQVEYMMRSNRMSAQALIDRAERQEAAKQYEAEQAAIRDKWIKEHPPDPDDKQTVKPK